MRQITASVVNIDAHPHEPGTYGSLMKQLVGRKVAYRAERSMVVRGFDGDGQIRGGTIVTFTDFDPDAPWFDPELLDTADVRATEAARAAVQKIKPSMQVFRAALAEMNGSIHCLVVETKNEEGESLSISLVAEALRKLALGVLGDAPKMTVSFSVLSSNDEVERLLSKPNIQRLHVIVSMPNIDDGEAEDNAVQEELERLGATKEERILTAPVAKTGGIKPDEELKRLARVASRHGRVEVTHGSRGKTRIESTSDKPIVETAKPHDKEPYSSAFKGLIKQFITRLAIGKKLDSQ